MSKSTSTEPDAGAGADEIVEDIERTREELGETIDALAAKLDVKAQVKNSANQTKANVVDAAGHTAGAARQNWQEIAVVVVTALAAIFAWRRMS
jgi:CHAD domain-containing protein